MRLISLLIAVLVVPACSGDDPMTGDTPYATLQSCFDHHTSVEHLGPQEAIVVCCISHPIGGKTMSCGASSSECLTHVSAALTGVTQQNISMACTTYESQLGM